jgi:hypothetical protein
MNDQEIRAKSLEIAALIIGPNKDFASYDWKDISYTPPPYNEVRKYEFLAALIEQDICVGLPSQADIKYLIERHDVPALKKRFNL